MRGSFFLACSKLGILGHVLFCGRREKVGSELGGFAHVTVDFHLTLHKSDLRIELSKADLLEVVVCHSECCIGFSGRSGLAQALSILQVNLVDERWLGTLFGCDLESEN